MDMQKSSCLVEYSIKAMGKSAARITSLFSTMPEHASARFWARVLLAVLSQDELKLQHQGSLCRHTDSTMVAPHCVELRSAPQYSAFPRDPARYAAPVYHHACILECHPAR